MTEKEFIVPVDDIGVDGAYFGYTELIRCKDCKHWKSDADTGMACEFTNLSQPEDGFCNWAERRKHDE